MVDFKSVLLIFSLMVTATSCDHSYIRIPLLKADVGSSVVEPLISHKDQHYGYISIGSPAQNFTVLFDTSAAFLWVPSVDCLQDNFECQKRNQFNRSESSTYQVNGTQFEIRYPVAGLVGVVGVDTVNIAGLEVVNQGFGEATYVPNIAYLTVQFDGILGLGLIKEAVEGVTPLFYNMVDQGLLDQPVFSFYFDRNDTDDESGSELMLGGSDASHYDGQLSYIPLMNDDGWEVALNSVEANDVAWCTGGCKAVVSTGWTYITGPTQQIKELSATLGAKETGFSGKFEFDCSTIDQLPNVTLIIGGQTFNLTYEDYVIQKKLPRSCTSGFLGLDPPPPKGPYWNLGTVFLKAFYATFDLANKQIGFAPSI